MEVSTLFKTNTPYYEEPCENSFNIFNVEYIEILWIIFFGTLYLWFLKGWGKWVAEEKLFQNFRLSSYVNRDLL